MPGLSWKYVDENWVGIPTSMVRVFPTVCVCIYRNVSLHVWWTAEYHNVYCGSKKHGVVHLYSITWPLYPHTHTHTHTHTAAFVKGDQPKQFPTLQVRYKKGANPTLKLLDDTNTVQDTLA